MFDTTTLYDEPVSDDEIDVFLTAVEAMGRCSGGAVEVGSLRAEYDNFNDEDFELFIDGDKKDVTRESLLEERVEEARSEPEYVEKADEEFSFVHGANVSAHTDDEMLYDVDVELRHDKYFSSSEMDSIEDSYVFERTYVGHTDEYACVGLDYADE